MSRIVWYATSNGMHRKGISTNMPRWWIKMFWRKTSPDYYVGLMHMEGIEE